MHVKYSPRWNICYKINQLILKDNILRNLQEKKIYQGLNESVSNIHMGLEVVPFFLDSDWKTTIPKTGLALIVRNN